MVKQEESRKQSINQEYKGLWAKDRNFSITAWWILPNWKPERTQGLYQIEMDNV